MDHEGDRNIPRGDGGSSVAEAMTRFSVSVIGGTTLSETDGCSGAAVISAPVSCDTNVRLSEISEILLG